MRSVFQTNKCYKISLSTDYNSSSSSTYITY